MRLILTRPEEDTRASADALERMGHTPILAPLLHIVFTASPPVPRLDYQAILFSSANGVRALAHRPEAAWLADTRVVAVGLASSEAARRASFRCVSAADGDVLGLTSWVGNNLSPLDGPLLYASGAVSSGDLEGKLREAGFRIERVVLYEARPAESLPDAAAEALRSGNADGVLLFSPRTARIWAELGAQAELTDRLRGLVHYCLSANVARAVEDALGSGCAIEVAETPDEAAILRSVG